MHIGTLRKAMLGALALTAVAQAHADTLYAFNSNQIAVIDTLNLGAVSYINISGLAAGDRLLGVDLRPTDGLVYGLTNTNKLYTFDVATGAGTLKANLTGASLTGQAIGVDFNPSADFAGNASLRVVTAAGNNYAVNANTGLVGNTASNIGVGYTAVAYTNSAPGVNPGPGDTTDLYYINTANDSLNVLGSAFNNPASVGGIQFVGSLGLDVLSASGFDILGNNRAYAIFNLDNGTLDSQLFSINLNTGSATYITTLNGTFNGVTGIAAAVPEPESYTMIFAGLALVAGIASRKSKKNA